MQMCLMPRDRYRLRDDTIRLDTYSSLASPERATPPLRLRFGPQGSAAPCAYLLGTLTLIRDTLP